MKVYRGTVDNVVDITNTGMLWVNLPFAVNPVPVTYVSPFSNIDSGFFAVPTPTSEVLVMEIDSEDTAPGKGSGLYYLGSIVGVKQSEANDVDYTKLDLDTEADITAAASLKPQNPRINWTSMGRDSKYPPSIPEAADDAYEANAVTPEKVVLADNANNAVVLANQGRGGTDGYQNTYAKLKTGRGKQVVLNDSPRQKFIKLDPGDGENNYMIFGGSQDNEGAQDHTISTGELRVDTKGPINHTSRNSGQSFTVLEGNNIDIKNRSTGFLSWSPTGRRMVGVGGGIAIPVINEEEVQGFSTTAGDSLRENWTQLPVTTYTVGQIHPDENPPGSRGNPLDKGPEDWGCVNIESSWNNINLEAKGIDSVIHVNAPGKLTKVVVTTGGTVDIIAKQKISITSDEKIELNAPHVDINGLARVDLD